MTQKNPADFDQVMNDPSAYYATPGDVLRDNQLTRDQKIAVLKLWAFDAQEIEVAQAENMQGEASILQQVLLALHRLQ